MSSLTAERVGQPIRHQLSDVQDDFVHDQHRYALFLGGIGAGKSHAGAVKALVQEIPRGPRLGLVVAPCYDDQTEVLTERRGWRLFRDLVPDDRVATLRDGEFLEYQLPRQTFDFPYTGEMVYLRSQELDLAMTPNHRCWTRFKTWDWQIKTAEEIYGKWDWRFKKTAIWHNDLPITEEGVDYFEYLGFWFAEGSAQHAPEKGKYRVTVTQKKHVDYAVALLDRAGVRYATEPRTNGGFNFVTYSKAISAEFVTYGKAHTKAVPQWIKDAPVGHLRAFLRGFIKGDGHEKVGTHDQTQMWTVSKQLADDLQEIAFKAGFSANVAQHHNGYYLCIRQRAKEEPKTHRDHWSRAPYDGRVYCVEVPNGLIYVRRNGKGVWCGNTYPMLRDATWRTALEVWEPVIAQVLRNEMRIVLTTGAEVLFRSADEPDRLRGPNASWVWIDEAAQCHPDTWLIAIGRLRQAGSAGRAWLTTTPRGMNWVFETFVTRASDDTTIFRSTTWANPFLDRSFVSSLHEQYDGVFARQELDAEFVADVAGSLLAWGWLDAASKRPAVFTPDLPVQAGVDVAGPGEDETVLCVRQGDAILALEAWSLADSRGAVVAALAPWKSKGLDAVAVDVVGMGHYFASALEDAGLPVVRVNVGEAPTDDAAKLKYANLRAQLFWTFREWAEGGMLAGLADQTALAQLAGLRYSHDVRGHIVIEKKDDARKRGVTSPDRAEAIVLAFWARPTPVLSLPGTRPIVRSGDTFDRAAWERYEAAAAERAGEAAMKRERQRLLLASRSARRR